MIMTSTRLTGAVVAATLALAAAGPFAVDAQAQDSNPGIHLSIDEIRALAGQVRAGRSLQPASWPNGARVAVMISFDVDNDTILIGRNPAPSIGGLSQGEYGARVGLERCVELMDRHGIPASFFIPAVSLVLRPDMVDVIQASGRHEFGLDPYYRDPLRATPWRFPVPRMLADRPWHVEGALLGLGLATAELRLQQIMTNQPPVGGPLGSHERDGLAATVALFNPYGRTESETLEIAKAVEAGRRRAMRLAGSPEEVPAVAAAAGLGRRRSALLAWTAAREPDRLDEWLSLREFLWLGVEGMDAGDSGGDAGSVAERLSDWGAYAGRLDGCLCLRLAPPRLRWENWRGRAGSGLVAALAPDLTLWVGKGFAARGLPVSLSGPVLEVAMRYMLDRVQPAHLEDWNTVLRYPSTLRDADFEDYVSSLTGMAVLRPADLPAARVNRRW